ncbi:hypothetical protein FSP39_021444 [Pinctada imbricata]|uniref:Replication termination factor 2 n=1 Tax=Pinctada imbricata TaxID=66713 RepID=A0AA88Y314_PINIB|nr:hypothetical protein FSP39_021444 [Pinctada imbricata]
MGCDGGTIPKRDELVRTKKKPEQKDKTADLDAKWKHCAITQEPLREPVMACELGRLYNKESVLEFLIDRSKFECAASFEHLRGLKDLKQLNLTENKGYERPHIEKGDAYIDTQDAKYICPVVGITMNGKHKFCFIWSCGCVLSERALKEVKTDVCHKCGKPLTTDNIIILNGTEDEVTSLRSKMEEKRLKAKLEKKAKKAHKHALSCDENGESTGDSTTDGPSVKKHKKLEESSAKGKLTNGIPVKSSKLNGLANGKTDDKTKISVQKDPSASSAYKSLFTSSDKAKKQGSAHWVTYNPFYN